MVSSSASASKHICGPVFLNAIELIVHQCSGAFDSLILSDDGQTCLGAVAKDGTRYLADRVVLATGAWSPSLVDLEEQCCSKVSSRQRLSYLEH